jgi:hypothetical protein
MLAIEISLYFLHVSVFVTPSSGRPLCYLPKNYMLFAVLLYMLRYKIKRIPCFFLIYSTCYNV